MRLAMTVLALIVSFGSVAHADSFLGNVSQLFDCKYKEEDLGFGTPVSVQRVGQIPGQTPICVAALHCERNHTPSKQLWVKKLDVEVACPVAAFHCPKTAAECISDKNAGPVSMSYQTSPNELFEN